MYLEVVILLMCETVTNKNYFIMKTIGFCNQKGGCGKTTLTIFLASYLAYDLKKRVIVLDCDYPQLSLKNTRNAELESLKESGENIPQQENIYAVESAEMKHFVSAKKAYEEQGYDYMLVDLPGSASNSEMMICVSQLDYVFIPLETEKKAARATFDFAAVVVNEFLYKDKYPLKSAHFIWSKFITNENTAGYEFIKNRLFAGFAERIEFLATHFNHSVAYKRPEFNRTISALDRKIITKNKLNINELLEEIVQKIENNGQ